MKTYFVKSWVTGKVYKTKHIVFYYSRTNCFRFGFKINKSKAGKLNIVTYLGPGILQPIDPKTFKAEIKRWKERCDKAYNVTTVNA